MMLLERIRYMFYRYKFWHSLTHPSYFTEMLENNEVRGYKKRVLFVFLLTVLFFMARDFWGMGTESLTTLFASNENDTYVMARLISLVGAAVLGVVYFLFHYYGVAYILHVFTDIPSRWIQKVQLYVISFLVLEKAILAVVFFFVGYTTPLSFMSLAPMTTLFIEEDVIIYILNQVTLATVVTIIVQYIFLAKWEETENHKSLLVKVILLQVFFALFVGMLSILPLKEWFVRGLS